MRSLTTQIGLTLLLFLVAGLALAGQPGSAFAQSDIPDTTETSSTAAHESSAGFGTSYWGEIPPPADSLTTVFQNRTTPGWQKALYLPIRVVLVPLWLVDRGTSALVNFTFKEPFQEAAAFLAIPGPWGSYFQPSFQAGGLSGFGLGVRLLHDDFFGNDNKLRLELATTVEWRYESHSRRRVSGKEKSLVLHGCRLSWTTKRSLFWIWAQLAGATRELLQARCLVDWSSLP